MKRTLLALLLVGLALGVIGCGGSEDFPVGGTPVLQATSPGWAFFGGDWVQVCIQAKNIGDGPARNAYATVTIYDAHGNVLGGGPAASEFDPSTINPGREAAAYVAFQSEEPPADWSVTYGFDM